MSAFASKSVPVLVRVVHLAGSFLGAAGVLLFIVFAIGQGLPPLAATNVSFAALAIMLVGFLLVWWNDLIGGIVSLAGIACFEALEIGANGHPAGGVFYMFFVPGAVSLMAWLVKVHLADRDG